VKTHTYATLHIASRIRVLNRSKVNSHKFNKMTHYKKFIFYSNIWHIYKIVMQTVYHSSYKIQKSSYTH